MGLPTIKYVEENSKVLEIGSLFRRLKSADWSVNVKLSPKQKKGYWKIANLSLLARRRIFNPTEEKDPAGYKLDVTIENACLWRVDKIKSCPILAVQKQGDANEWCFVFEHDEITYYLPQLELARSLFFHSNYLPPLSLIQNGLAHEFDIQRFELVRAVRVNIMPTCSLRPGERGNYAFRRFLAWLLLDEDVRASFESISRYQIQDGYNKGAYRHWNFRFDPPPLEKAKMTVRGHYDPDLKACFVYEVHGFTNITSFSPSDIEFFDPQYEERQAAKGQAVRPQSGPVADVEIDDEKEANSDRFHAQIETLPVKFEFANPMRTTRVGKQSTSMRPGGREAEEKEDTPGNVVDLSADEASLQGTLPSADYDGLEDISEDAHLYADKFTAFNQMVELLLQRQDCTHVGQAIRKLPRVSSCLGHILESGDPRCLAFHLIAKNGTTYALVEIDLSDNKPPLSTLLLRQPSPSFDWGDAIRKLEVYLLKASLKWPTPFVEEVFGYDYKRIPHPKTSSANKALLEKESIQHWAGRAYIGICSF